jgi:tRNA pseudouridine38-40 synthase
LEAALERIVRRPVGVTVAGRTDAGVHASGQVAQIDLRADELGSLDRLVRRLNAVLGPQIRLLDATVVGDGFDARFSALWRQYRYRIADQLFSQDPLQRHRTWWTAPLDHLPMQQAAEALLGEHDFASYCIPKPGGSTVRTLLGLDVQRPGAGLVTVVARADAFGHHMVRFLVGALVAVGRGQRPAQWPAQVLAERRRDPRVQLAPAHGLTLQSVAYPLTDAAQAAQALASRVLRTPSS